MMHYTTELLDDNTLLFRFTVPAEEYTAALDDAWRTHKARYPVPGMRDGKASRTMIERHHGKDVFEKAGLGSAGDFRIPQSRLRIPRRNLLHPYRAGRAA